jgi:hypothetical protein
MVTLYYGDSFAAQLLRPLRDSTLLGRLKALPQKAPRHMCAAPFEEKIALPEYGCSGSRSREVFHFSDPCFT